MPKDPGGPVRLHDATAPPPSYSDLGIEKTQAHRWQQIADVPEEARRFEKEQRQAKAWDLWLNCWTQEEIADLLGLSTKTAQEYCRDAKRDEKEQQRIQARDMWLDCHSLRSIEAAIGVSKSDVEEWVSGFPLPEQPFRDGLTKSAVLRNSSKRPNRSNTSTSGTSTLPPASRLTSTPAEVGSLE